LKSFFQNLLRVLFDIEMMNVKKSEYYPTEILIKDIDPDLGHTPDSLFQALKHMRIGIISNVDMAWERGQYPYAIVQFEKWNTATTREMRSKFEKGLDVPANFPYLGHRAFMVDYQQRNRLQNQKQEKERRLKEEEYRLRKQLEEEYRLKKQKKEEDERRLKEEESRRNREEAKRFEKECEYINDDPITNDLEIDYGDEETLFFKFNKKTGNMDYKGRQYIVYV
jgi:hypothetical protein